MRCVRTSCATTSTAWASSRCSTAPPSRGSDPGPVPVIDLNADLGEADAFGETERAVLGAVTSTSVSCGAHAGSPAAIRATIEAAARAGVVIGAHPSYPDRAGMGRRPFDIEPANLTESLMAQ